MSRLTIDVTDQQHQALKAMAALEGKSIRQYTLERLFPAASNQADQQAMTELKTLLQERINQAERGDVIDTSITKLAHDLLDR